MSNSKYYDDGQTQYAGYYGQLYYDKVNGPANPGVAQQVHWMSNINLSRTARTKAMYVNPQQGFNSVQSQEISVSQSKSPLLLLVGSINGKYAHGITLPTITDPTIRNSACTEYVQPSQLGSPIDIIVLTNGNVINADFLRQGNIVSSIEKNISYYQIKETDIPKTHGNNPYGQEYQEYPIINGTSLTTYIGKELDNKPFSNARGSFDDITHTGNVISNIDITYGGVLYTENTDFSEKENLVAIKITVHLVDDINHADSPSVIEIVSAVYDEDDANGINQEYQNCKIIDIEFKLNTDTLSIEVDGDLNFDEQGISNNTHEPELEITSSVPWEIGEYNTGTAQ